VKQPPESDDAARLMPIAEELRTRYEELRKNIVTGATSTPPARGLAVFLRHGMTRWMKISSELVPARSARRPEATSSQPIVPAAIEPEVVNVLAEMALGTQGN
jgi:hypothetical protein